MTTETYEIDSETRGVGFEGPPQGLARAEVDALVQASREAQRVLAAAPEPAIDDLLDDMGRRLGEEATDLAARAVAETGLGNIPDKAFKNRLSCTGQVRAVRGEIGTGVVSEADGLVEIASPVGVVFAVVPVTVPTSAILFKAVHCLKARNAVIFSCSRHARRCGRRTVELLREALAAHGLPADAVQVLPDRADRAAVHALMGHEGVDLILATGGRKLVAAAYSSGTPAYGVGDGNTPVLVCDDADLERTAGHIVASKPFDHGTICGSEHNLVVDRRVRTEFARALERAGAAVLAEAERDRARAAWFEHGELRRELLGKAPEILARLAGIQRPYPIRLLVFPAARREVATALGREKLMPLVSLFAAEDFEDGIALCRTILARQGAGHTAVIHTRSRGRMARFGACVPAGRLLVNTPAVQGMLGLTTPLETSWVLGCGTFGGNSTTDGITFRHLVNIKRLARGA